MVQADVEMLVVLFRVLIEYRWSTRVNRFQEGVDYRGLIKKEGARGPYSWCRVVHGPEAGVAPVGAARDGRWGTLYRTDNAVILSSLSCLSFPSGSQGAGVPCGPEARVERASVEKCQLPWRPYGGDPWVRMQLERPDWVGPGRYQL